MDRVHGTYTLFTYEGDLSFNDNDDISDAFTLGDMPGGYSYQIGNTTPSDGNPKEITLTAVPEPTSLALLGFAAAN